MSRNLVHKLQSRLFADCELFHFLNMDDVDNLVNMLVTNIQKSPYTPDLIVGISSGGNYPANKLSEKLNIPSSMMAVSHYSLNIGCMELDEIVGVYFLAKKLGHKHITKLISPVDYQAVCDKRILLVDDDAYSGKTLEIAKEHVLKASPLEVKTAVLHTYSNNVDVDFTGKDYPKEIYYASKFRFPWSKISPYYVD